ncbi:4-hydroxy-3-methylbut-2-enyl diphosphate reductase [Desulfovibrio mangrovi]|uniref:4-hydroxy-3-methylbut-2-enyl diphosphate reductase n=1 Tax=Desulfovibrio mangrovi TaxID=2976983 RepID=UPI0022479BC0|nr:4-hydroxy-3-methylbut-2-enyl diphosphate reductase [Desulfovibrio mangrovi]UZP66850.1 4-hydroxy-3-methylbut-2-enyl diphosphate reductase [Desulfovibrio mangrovi]
MKVRRAETAGFCMGVSLALQKLDTEVAREDGAIATLGPIIHNPQVLEQYEKLGVRCIKDPADARKDERVIIRAHGIPHKVEGVLQSTARDVVDATCPKVKRAQLGIARKLREGCTLLLFGEKDHPEVRGLMSYAGEDAFVFGEFDELKAYPFEEGKRYCVAAQTTQDRKVFTEIVDWLRKKLGEDLPVLETICDATRERQEEAIALAREVDAMVVVGGYNSGNTRRLADVARAQGCLTVHVETPEELDPEQLKGAKVVGLTAGASTPKHIIDAMQKKLEAL